MPRTLTTRRLFEVVLLLGLFAMAARTVGDPDFWWHLRTGQLIIASHSIPHTDVYSHTKYGAPWIAHEWLSEVVIYGLYWIGGYAALIVGFAMCIAGAFWITLLRSPGRPYVAGIAMLWGAIATIPFWGVRPQMFSLLLTSVFLFLLDRFDETGNPVVLWWMPPLMVFWVNLHGGFAIGLALMAVAIGCKLLDAAANRPVRAGTGLCPVGSTTRVRSKALADARSLALVMAAASVAILINPNGYRMYVYPFETLASSSMQSLISEWASPNFHLREMQPAALLLIGTFGALIAAGKRPRTRAFLLLVATAFAALRSSRHIPLFALVAIPVLSGGAESLLISPKWAPAFRNDHARPPRTALNSFIAIALALFCVIRVYIVAKRQPSFEARELPSAAVQYIRQQRPPAPIFNSYEWGGYLIWKLYPDCRVFVDGRADVYGDKFLNDFVHTYNAENDWRSVLRKYDIRTAVLPPDAPIAVSLRGDPAWRTVFQDKVSAVFVRDTSYTPSTHEAAGECPISAAQRRR